MHRYRSLFHNRFLVFALVFIPWIATFSTAGERDTLSIPYLDTSPAIDGNSDDWSSIEPFILRDSRVADSLKNIVQIFLGWDEEQFYVCCVVNDTRLCTDKDINDTINIHLNDAIEVWIDSHNDSKTILDENDYHFIIDALNRVALFRGDKTLIEMGEKSGTVPQRTGNTPILYKHAARYNGTVNSSLDLDTGYVVELSIPWSAMGIESHQGLSFKLDICLDDQDMPLAKKPPNLIDSLGELYYLSFFHFVNWSGYRDFGYPNTWKQVTLVGSPGLLTTLSKHYSRYWLLAFLITVIGSFLTIGFMAYRIIQLKHMPARTRVAVHPVVAVPETAGSTPQVSYQQKIILTAREYIEENISVTITSETLANHLAMSTRQLQRIVKEELQTTPTNLIHIVRLEKAASLLARKEGNVTEIAFEVGFNDSSHFSKLFKKYYGVAPSQYSGGAVPPQPSNDLSPTV